VVVLLLLRKYPLHTRLRHPFGLCEPASASKQRKKKDRYDKGGQRKAKRKTESSSKALDLPAAHAGIDPTQDSRVSAAAQSPKLAPGAVPDSSLVELAAPSPPPLSPPPPADPNNALCRTFDVPLTRWWSQQMGLSIAVYTGAGGSLAVLGAVELDCFFSFGVAVGATLFAWSIVRLLMVRPSRVEAYLCRVGSLQLAGYTTASFTLAIVFIFWRAWVYAPSGRSIGFCDASMYEDVPRATRALHLNFQVLLVIEMFCSILFGLEIYPFLQYTLFAEEHASTLDVESACKTHGTYPRISGWGSMFSSLVGVQTALIAVIFKLHPSPLLTCVVVFVCWAGSFSGCLWLLRRRWRAKLLQIYFGSVMDESDEVEREERGRTMRNTQEREAQAAAIDREQHRDFQAIACDRVAAASAAGEATIVGGEVRDARHADGVMKPSGVDGDDSDDFSALCVICIDAENTHIVLPCGHKCLCERCAPGVVGKPCPMCRVVCEAVCKVYGR